MTTETLNYALEVHSIFHKIAKSINPTLTATVLLKWCRPTTEEQ